MSSSYSGGNNYSQDIQDKANSLGITPQLYMQIAGGPSSNYNSYTGMANQQNYGANPSDQSGDTYTAVADYLRANQGLNKPQTQQPTQPSTVAQNPMYDLSNLGAAALGEQAVYNAMPGPADKKSGIGTVTQPQITTNKAVAPQGPWSNMPGVFGKQGSNQVQGQAPANTPALDTIGTKMTPTQFSDVANQIRNGSNNYVTVNGKPYTITGDNITHITQAYPSQQSQWTQTAPQTQQLTPNTPVTAAGAAGGSANAGGAFGGAFTGGNAGDFGAQVASNAIQNEIQRQLAQGNAYASTSPGIPAGWHPSNTGQPPPGNVQVPTPNPVQTNLPPPAPVNTSNAPANAAANASTALLGAAAARGMGGNSMGGATASAAGGAGAGLTYMQKMQMLDNPAVNAGANAAKQWTQNVGNSFRPIASAIPGPENFQRQNYNIPALSTPRAV